mmetsp:Transcript_14094/g.23326  ORF Transcript_14094/g.23326 Transcript_14094/m.23326 type:complete len:283 (+) Transcript_14094:148-996(+)
MFLSQRGRRRHVAVISLLICVCGLYYWNWYDVDIGQDPDNSFNDQSGVGSVVQKVRISRQRITPVQSRVSSSFSQRKGKNTTGLIVGTCKNTVQGKKWITDDRGYVCERADLDSAQSGCCLSVLDYEQYSCSDCLNGCCKVYEVCVSCCLGPSQRAVVESIRTLMTGLLFKSIDNLFDYCKEKCRTNSKSVVHENSYVSDAKHCYGQVAPFIPSAPPTPSLPSRTPLPSPSFSPTLAPSLPSHTEPPAVQSSRPEKAQSIPKPPNQTPSAISSLSPVLNTSR